MSLHRLQTMTPIARTPVRGHEGAAVVTPAGVKPQEIEAAQKVRGDVSVSVLDAFLKAKAGETPKQKGLVPSLMALLGSPPKAEPASAKAKALHETLAEAVNTLSAVYADGLVT